MKPRNQYERNIVELKNAIEPISSKQNEWAIGKIFPSYFVKSRKTNYCLECGHTWKPDEAELTSKIIGYDCPECGNKLKSLDNYKGRGDISEYWAVLTTFKGFQVVRIVCSSKHMEKGEVPTYNHNEVLQHWIAPDGELTTLSMPVSGTYYFDSWTHGDLEIRTQSQHQILRQNIKPSAIYPKRKILPIIKRNGLKTSFYGEAPHRVISTILSSPKAETLLKAKQISIFRSCVNGQDYYTKRFWSSIKIAIRNGYIVEDAVSYFDYLNDLDFLNLDLNSPRYVCPADFEAEHRRVGIMSANARKKQREADRLAKIVLDQENYEKSKSAYFDLEFMVDQVGIKIVTLKSIEEFIEEGKKLHHCVDSYYDRENSLIMSARMEGKPIETIEIDLKNLRVNQARGFANKATEYNDYIVNAVEMNMSKIAQRTNLKVA